MQRSYRSVLSSCHALLSAIIVVAVLLSPSTTTMVWAVKSETALFGTHAVSYSNRTAVEFSNALTPQHLPFTLFLFDDTDTAVVTSVWQRVIRDYSDAAALFTLRTGYVSSLSPLGKELLDGFQLTPPAVLLFDGLLRPIPNHPESFGKLPVGYSGDVSVPKMVRWLLSNLSPDLITRVDTEEDLGTLFGKYPGFPEMPRVLYFPSNDYVGPVYRVLSMVFQADAAFGVVVKPFETDEKTAIAKRYGVESKADLPAILVLQPQENGNADDVIRLKNVTVASSVEDIAAQLRDALPDSAIRAMELYAATGHREAVDVAHRRKMYVLEELARERVELFGDSIDEPGRFDGAAAQEVSVVVVQSEAEWQRHCVQMLKGSYCLVVVAEKSDIETATATLKEAAAKILKSVSVALRARMHFVVLDSARSAAIMNYFEVGKQGMPDAVLLTSATPRTFYNFIGSYSPDNLVRFFLSKTQASKPVGGSRYFVHMVPSYEDAAAPVNNSEAQSYNDDL